MDPVLERARMKSKAEEGTSPLGNVSEPGKLTKGPNTRSGNIVIQEQLRPAGFDIEHLCGEAFLKNEFRDAILSVVGCSRRTGERWPV